VRLQPRGVRFTTWYWRSNIKTTFSKHVSCWEGKLVIRTTILQFNYNQSCSDWLQSECQNLLKLQAFSGVLCEDYSILALRHFSGLDSIDKSEKILVLGLMSIKLSPQLGYCAYCKASWYFIGICINYWAKKEAVHIVLRKKYCTKIFPFYVFIYPFSLFLILSSVKVNWLQIHMRWKEFDLTSHCTSSEALIQFSQIYVLVDALWASKTCRASWILALSASGLSSKCNNSELSISNNIPVILPASSGWFWWIRG